MVGEASPERYKWLQLFPHFDGVSGGVGELVGLWCLGAVAGAVAVTAFKLFVLPFLPCFVGEFSVAFEEL